MFLDQTYAQNQANSQRGYTKKGVKNIKNQPTEKISINAVGVQTINGNSFISFLDSTKTLDMMKFIITITMNNITNNQLKNTLNEFLTTDELNIENILNTINEEENYNKLIITLEPLIDKNKTIKKLYERLIKNPLNFQTKSEKTLNDLQKSMLLALFSDKELQHDLIMEKPIAVILDNYSVHHAIYFKELANVLNMDLIYLPPYSPKYNPIEQVWRTIKAIISRKYITSEVQLKFIFENEFNKVVNKSSYWKNWMEKFL